MEEEKKETSTPSKKIDVSKLVSIIPSPAELRGEEKKITEKRIRVKYDETLPAGYAKFSKKLAELLGITENDMVEIVVAGRKKFIYKSMIVEDTDVNTVYCNPSELKPNGVADNSIATIRKYKGV